mgnify:CR=1 FL=1
MSRYEILREIENNIDGARIELAPFYNSKDLDEMEEAIWTFLNRLDERDLKVIGRYDMEAIINLLECYKNL